MPCSKPVSRYETEGLLLQQDCISAGVRGPAAPAHDPVLVRRGAAAPHQNGGFGGAQPRRTS